MAAFRSTIERVTIYFIKILLVLSISIVCYSMTAQSPSLPPRAHTVLTLDCERNERLNNVAVSYRISTWHDTIEVKYYSKNGLIDSVWKKIQIPPSGPTPFSGAWNKVYYTYDSNEELTDTEYWPHLGDLRQPDNKGKYYVQYGDTLTIGYDTTGTELTHIVNKYDQKTRIFSHYTLNCLSGLVGFRNITRYNENMKPVYTTIHTSPKNSYTINYYYNDHDLLITRIRTEAQTRRELIISYTYNSKSLLERSCSSQNIENRIYTKCDNYAYIFYY